MKIIWNDEATAPEAPFFAAPLIEEEAMEAPELLVEECDNQTSGTIGLGGVEYAGSGKSRE